MTKEFIISCVLFFIVLALVIRGMIYLDSQERWVAKCYKSHEFNQITNKSDPYFFINYYSTEQSAIKTAEQYRKIADCVCVVYEN